MQVRAWQGDRPGQQQAVDAREPAPDRSGQRALRAAGNDSPSWCQTPSPIPAPRATSKTQPHPLQQSQIKPLQQMLALGSLLQNKLLQGIRTLNTRHGV